MKIAVEGCTHGQLDLVYDTIRHLETENDVKVDLLLCCGDFQATRNLDDLTCMACPPKYREMCTFYKYYCGEKLAPVLTIFVGGNHEASNHLQELPFGGWVAPNIYYLGYAGVVKFGNLRIAGLSGIFNGADYYKGRYERPPYNPDSMRSCYHIRNLDVFRLKQLSQPIHIMMSHDWPAGIYHHGNVQQLLKHKPFLRDDIEKEMLGSKPTGDLVHQMKPYYWFAAHLHTKFAALVQHDEGDAKKVTKFLALDKCLPRRRFLQVVDIETDSKEAPQLEYDLEWLTILHLTNHLLSVKKVNVYMPTADCNERWNFTPTAEEMDGVRKKFDNNLKIPENFVVNAPVYNPQRPRESEGRLEPRSNPQTVQFCERLGVDDPMTLLVGDLGDAHGGSFNSSLIDSSSFIGSTDSELDATSTPPGSGLRGSSSSSFRTPLRLPKPLNSFDISVDECLTSTPYKAETSTSATAEKRLPPSDEPKSAKDETEDSSLGSAKKLSRRNFEIYALKDE